MTLIHWFFCLMHQAEITVICYLGVFYQLPDPGVHPGKLTWNLKMNPWKRRSFSGSMLVFWGGSCGFPLSDCDMK